MKVIRLTLLILICCSSFTWAQLSKTYCIKFDPTAGIFGEFRLSYEHKMSSYKYFYSSAGFYHKESQIGEEEGKPPAAWKTYITDFFKSPYNKFLYSSAGFFYRDFKPDREKIFGPVVRFGIKQYVKTKNAPLGPFFYIGLNYAFLQGQYFDENYNKINHQNFHKPGFTLSGGHQWLFGLKDTYAVCVYGGCEYYYIATQPDFDKSHFWDNMPRFALYAGVEVGFCFRQKKLHW